jgi:hypothetical protein
MKKILLLLTALSGLSLINATVKGNPNQNESNKGNPGEQSQDNNPDPNAPLSGITIDPNVNFKVITSKVDLDALIASNKPVVLKLIMGRLINPKGQNDRDQAIMQMKRFKEIVSFCKIDLDASQDLIATYQVSHVPLYIFFKNGKEVSRRAGYHFRLEEYKRRVASLLNKDEAPGIGSIASGVMPPIVGGPTIVTPQPPIPAVLPPASIPPVAPPITPPITPPVTPPVAPPASIPPVAPPVTPPTP